ncbi:MAG: hypothetical protein AABX10_04960 [Nanoarchaeota archaeon]
MMNMLTVAVIILMTCSVGAFATHAVGEYFDNRNHENEINSFEECANSGFVVIQTYPLSCIDSLGTTFYQEILN